MCRLGTRPSPELGRRPPSQCLTSCSDLKPSSKSSAVSSCVSPRVYPYHLLHLFCRATSPPQHVSPGARAFCVTTGKESGTAPCGPRPGFSRCLPSQLALLFSSSSWARGCVQASVTPFHPGHFRPVFPSLDRLVRVSGFVWPLLCD